MLDQERRLALLNNILQERHYLSIKSAILQGLASINRKMGKLNLENITDPLTNLVNRRGMEIALDEWQALQQPFAVIMADNRSLQSD